MKSKITLFQRHAKAVSFLTAITLNLAGHTQAAELNWNATTGDFETAANWLVGAGPGTGIPGTLDFANVANGGTAQYSTAAAKTVAEVRAGNGASGSIQISAPATFTSTGNVYAGRATGAGTGTLTVTGTGTVFTLAAGSGNTLIGASSADIGTVGGGSTGVLNVNSGAVYNHNNNGGNSADSFRVGDNTLLQAGTYKGTLNVNGGTLNIANSRLNVGQSKDGVGEVTVTNNGAINVNNNWIVIGRGGSGKLTLSSGVITKSGANNFAVGDSTGTGVFDQTGGTLTLNTGELFLGNGANAKGTYNLSAGAVTVTNWAVVGRNGGNGTLDMSGGTITKSGGGNFSVANGTASTGLAEHRGGSINVTGGEFFIGNDGATSAIYNLSGTASVLVNNWIAIGRNNANGTLNMTGGTITKTGTTANNMTIGTGGGTNHGKLNISGGLLNLTLGELYVGEGSLATVDLSSNGEIRTSGIKIAVNSGSNLGLLKLNGGTLKTSRIYGGSGTSAVEFNGTGIHATASQALFLDNLGVAELKAGGAIINTEGFNLGTSNTQVISGTGGLTKQGLGNLTLSGPNTYTGPTVVSAGKLIVSTASVGTGSYDVASGATLGVKVHQSNENVSATSLTLADSTLDIDLGTSGLPAAQGSDNPTGAPINVSGALTSTGGVGSVTVNLTGSDIVTGQFPLIKYGSFSGNIANFKAGTMPIGISATFVDNPQNQTIDLKLVLRAPIWGGQNGGAWDTSTLNWYEPTGDEVAFANGDPVLFNDSASVFDVTIAGGVTVRPGTIIRFNNSASDYTVTGAGKISDPLSGAPVGLTKQGFRNLILSTENTFTGPVRIEGGAISVATLPNGGVAGPLGASTAAPANLVLSSTNNGGVILPGTLIYTGPSITTDRGFTVAAAEATLEVTEPATTLNLTGTIASTGGGLVKKGAGMLSLYGAGAHVLGTGNVVRIESGKLAIIGTGTAPVQTVTAGELWVGNTTASGASLDLTNTTLNVSTWLAVGRGNGNVSNLSTVNVTGSTLTVQNFSSGYANGLANTSTQEVNFTNSTFNSGGSVNIAESRGSTSTITLTGTSIWNTREILIATDNNGTGTETSTGTLIIGGTSVVNCGTPANIAYVSIGRNAGKGTLIVKENGSFLNQDDFSLGEQANSNGSGTIILQDNGVISTRTGLFGRGATNTALITQTGGTFSNSGDFMRIGVDGNATWNLSGGVVNSSGNTQVGTFAPSTTSSLNISGTGTYNQVTAASNLIVGDAGKGALNVSETGTVNASGGLRGGLAASGEGVITQTGGTITVAKNVILGENGKATLNLSGGQFRVNTADTLNFVVGNFGAGQATLNISGSADVKLMNNASIRVGNESTTANNTVTQTGGSVTTYSDNGVTVGGNGAVVLGRNTASGTNTYNLEGGTLTVGAVRSENTTSTSVFNFKGGTLKASTNNANFMTGLTVVSVEAAGAKVDTNSRNVTINSALLDAGGGGGLTKTGAGTLTLAGANTYLGNTAINEGAVTLAEGAKLRFYIGANGVSSHITGTGTATLNGGFNLEVGSAALANGNSWTLVDGSVNKTYGASFNVVGFTESADVWTRVVGSNIWTFTEATGKLTLTVSSGTPYDTWIQTYFGNVTDPNIIGPAKDPDGDGNPNSLEFALGGNPNSGSDGPKVYSLQADGSVDGDSDKEQLLTIAVRTGTPAFDGSPSPSATKDGYTYTIQGSLDLLGFGIGVSPVNTVAPIGIPAPEGYEYRTFSLNGSNNLTGKGFMRVKVN